MAYLLYDEKEKQFVVNPINKTTKFESIKMAVRCAELMADKINQPITILQRLDSIYPTNTEWGG